MKEKFTKKSDGCFTMARAFGSTNGKSFSRYEVWANVYVPSIDSHTTFMIHSGKSYNKAYSIFRMLVNSRKELK